MDPEIAELTAAVKTMGEQVGSALAKLNEAPTVIRQDAAVGVAGTSTEAPVRRAMNFGEKVELRTKLKGLSDSQLSAFFFEQLRNKNAGGVPLDSWLNAGGYAAQQAFAGISNQVTPDVMKAIDTGGAAALIRQDLEPVLYELTTNSSFC